jgi:hypothetical protein
MIVTEDGSAWPAAEVDGFVVDTGCSLTSRVVSGSRSTKNAPGRYCNRQGLATRPQAPRPSVRTLICSPIMPAKNPMKAAFR